MRENMDQKYSKYGHFLRSVDSWLYTANESHANHIIKVTVSVVFAFDQV